MKKRIAIISTHPVQYNAPLFRALSEFDELTVKVFYTWSQAKEGIVFDPGFNRAFSWDIPLLEGYDYEFVENVSASPTSDNFDGIVNPSLIDIIRAWQPDGIIVYGWNYSSHFKLMRYFKGRVPIFFRGDSTLLDDKKGIASFLRRQILKRVYRKIDYAFYVGTNNHEYFRSVGLGDNRLIFAPHSINDALFVNAHEVHMQKVKVLKQQLGIGEDELIFLFAGKLIPKKNPDLLTRSFIDSNLKHAHLVIVGNGSMEAELKKIAEGHNNIHFLEFQNQTQMPVIYKLCDVYVLPSKGPDETWGLAVNEAMTCGKAIIVSNKVGCAVDLVKNEENGHIIDSSDRAALTVLLQHYSKEKAMQFGAVSKKIIAGWSLKETAIHFHKGILQKLKK